MRAVILAGLLFCVATPLLAAELGTPKGKGVSAKEEYELQERCGKRCKEAFKEHYPSESYRDEHGDQWLSNYEAHYNRKLNKCFILVTSHKFAKDDSYLDKVLVDVNSNKEYGVCSGKKEQGQLVPPVIFCNVLENGCQSEAEWDALVKPYIEE